MNAVHFWLSAFKTDPEEIHTLGTACPACGQPPAAAWPAVAPIKS